VKLRAHTNVSVDLSSYSYAHRHIHLDDEKLINRGESGIARHPLIIERNGSAGTNLTMAAVVYSNGSRKPL
jgi:hypothetical protein